VPREHQTGSSTLRKAIRRVPDCPGDLDAAYFRLRDFEYVQPLYDLAFFLEVDALANGCEVPKYRTFSLWRAAYSLDGYGTTIDSWLSGDSRDEDLDYVPSNRIRQYLTAVGKSGTIPELKPFRSERFERCLRLRSVRGLGPNKIALTVSSASLDEEWFTHAAISMSLDRDKLAEVYQRSTVGSWQSAHIVPPLLRFLRALEQTVGRATLWTIKGIESPLQPVITSVSVFLALSADSIQAALNRTLRQEKMFRVGTRSQDELRIRHQMGWAFSLKTDETRSGRSISELAQELDPFVSNDAITVFSDLHLHTAWSDGSASVETMAKAVAERGLTHFAVTDHSRTSKLQGGLTPPLWLRQANAISLATPVCSVLHGIEVDILRDGQLDLPYSLLQGADIVVASVHSNWTEDPQINTSRLIRAIHSGCVDILAHPTSALTGKPGVPDYIRTPADVDWEEVFRECAAWRVAIEFNCFPSRLDIPLSLLRRAVDCGCAISLGSDAHARSHLQHIRFGEAALRSVKAAPVLNCLRLDELRKWIAESRATRQTLLQSASPLVQGELFAEELPSPLYSLTATIQPPQKIPSGSKIVGIDLTAGNKATGIALLSGLRLETCSLSSDEEILGYIAKHKPKIVSIDSPLGLPGGGQAIDPKAGIVRVAEHDLASIGIPAYPALIDSMRELTLRGIRLRRSIEAFKSAPTVIESYPGAAQDILCIPRKQKSLGLLREGLRRLGVIGQGLDTKSHDEMDAATSAVVGRYFESGRFEPMGIASEAQLIVPKVPPLRFDRLPVICLAGKTGAGKSVVARYLSVFYGFEWLRTRNLIGDLLKEDLAQPASLRLFSRVVDPKNITESDLRDFGATILDQYHQVPLRDKLTRVIAHSNLPVVVDSVRDVSDVEPSGLSGRPIIIWFVECSDSVIQHRLILRSKLGQARLKTPSPVDHTAPIMRRAARRTIGNNGTLEELRWRIDDTLFADLSLRTT
jgi:histidinol phosphatase-like PHP family hydrolase/predicted nuclease with RNAse H fold/dephospho-CoA kinase